METKRQEDIRKLMQMPEEAIASLNESEADRLGRLAVMFYKETGDGVYKEKAEQIRAAQGELPEDICAMPFFMEYETCLLYTSPSPRDRSVSRMPSSA